MQFAVVDQPVSLKRCVSLQEHILSLLWFSDHCRISSFFKKLYQVSTLPIDLAIPGGLLRVQFALVPAQELLGILVVDVFSSRFLSVSVRPSEGCSPSVLVRSTIRISDRAKGVVVSRVPGDIASNRPRVESIRWLPVPPSLVAFFVPASFLHGAAHSRSCVCTSLGRSVEWSHAETCCAVYHLFVYPAHLVRTHGAHCCLPVNLCHSAEISAELAAPRSCEDVISN